MKRQPKSKECANPDCNNSFAPYKTTDKHCSPGCYYSDPKTTKRIKPISDKRKEENIVYNKLKEEFFSKPENQQCFIDGCYNPADSVEHRKGRKGYADDWARDNGITLFLDIRFWAPCCAEHNLELESNSELSKKYQLSKLHNGKKL